jgi:2-methylisocitrate lyase-like PEP mutase family enzyme
MIWKELLKKHKLLQLPVAHDALSAKLIQHAGFPAYQIGGFALLGTQFGYPDIDLVHYAEIAHIVENITAGCDLPVLVDCDNGYGDAKMAVRTVKGYDRLGIAAIFMEDQASPKKCGHMADKSIIPIDKMKDKIQACLSEVSDNLFFLARTDAYEVEGMEGALKRAEAYLDSGANGVYIEGISKEKDVDRAGREFGHVPLAISILENGGKTPWLNPEVLAQMGYSMVLYPATLLFAVVEQAKACLNNLLNGYQLDNIGVSVSMDEFEQIVNIDYWKKFED